MDVRALLRAIQGQTSVWYTSSMAGRATKDRPPVTIKVPKRSVKKDSAHETFSDLVFKPKSIRFEHQNDDEHLLMLVREHVVVLFSRMFSTLLLAIVPFLLLWVYRFLQSRGIAIFDISTNWWLVAVVLWYMLLIVSVFKQFIDWFYNVNIMTTQRFIDLDFKTFSGYHVKETPLMKIQDASDTHGGPWQMIFDMGNLTIYTASDKTTFQLPNVPASSQVRDFVMDTVIAYTDQFKSEDIINAP